MQRAQRGRESGHEGHIRTPLHFNLHAVRFCCDGGKTARVVGNKLFDAGGGLHRPNHLYESRLAGMFPQQMESLAGTIVARGGSDLVE